ncbi:hypothetical protein [Halomontanus rarus]|uniref:hypothetical protein n=1 Tax=Halomontanus rarus TaxID=3034020 RepID=UPI0023E8937F|nr:hypothetical protein [Halovivax sp. TS33]
MSENDTADAFEVADFVVIGRTFEEYLAMFDLEPADLEGRRVLDCPSGTDSFVATAHERGVSVTGADVLYRHPPAVVARRCRADVAAVAEQLPDKRHLFEWEYYGSVDRRVAFLERASERFLADYPTGRLEGRYAFAELPELPFASDSFSLVLSAHLLFLYGDRLEYEFHLESLRELARVATDEVRVYPLQGLDAEPYERLDEVLETLRADGYDATLIETPFEFQTGSTDMLVLSV